MKHHILPLFALAFFALMLPCSAEEVHCPGAYEGHLQGIALDAGGDIYWSFTVALVKTDPQGKLMRTITVPSHHGDLWVDGETVYAAVNFPHPDADPGKRQSWIYAYNTNDLSLRWKKELPEVDRGAGGLAMRDGHFFVASGRLLNRDDENIIYEYDSDCRLVARHVLESSRTWLGIQTIAYAGHTWYFGCYGKPPETLRASEGLVFQDRFPFDTAMGIAPRPGGGFYLGRGDQDSSGNHRGWVITVDQVAQPQESVN